MISKSNFSLLQKSIDEQERDKCTEINRERIHVNLTTESNLISSTVEFFCSVHTFNIGHQLTRSSRKRY